MIRFPSAQRVEANGRGVEIQLAADQAMGPAGIHLEGTTEETDSAGLRGATEEDHQPVGSHALEGSKPDQPIPRTYVEHGGPDQRLSASQHPIANPGQMLESNRSLALTAPPRLVVTFHAPAWRCVETARPSI